MLTKITSTVTEMWLRFAVTMQALVLGAASNVSLTRTRTAEGRAAGMVEYVLLVAVALALFFLLMKFFPGFIGNWLDKLGAAGNNINP